MKHIHSKCGCGSVKPYTEGYHELGTMGCKRKWMKGQPIMVSPPNIFGMYTIDGHPFSAHQILTQRGAGCHQHDCGCWSAVM